MKVILIDDEKLALDYFEYQLMSVSDYNVIGKFTDPFEGKRMIEQYDVDIVFLDIQIPDLNGMELAEKILEKKPKLPIVFVTAYDKYAIKAFELNAIDYILKPVSTTRLLTTVKRIEQQVKDNASYTINKVNQLQLNLFQQVTLLGGSEGQMNPIPLKWRTLKTQQLFLYLVQHREQEVSKTLLIELLWPDLQLENAYQQLYTSIYHLRQTLGNYSNHFTVNSIGEGYMLKLEDVAIDVEQFETIIQSLSPLTAENLTDYEKTLAIYKGDYLQNHGYIWAESERHRLQLQWVNMALKVIDWYYEQNNLNKALTLSLEICERYPMEENAYFYLMKIYQSIGNYPAVHQQYKELQKLLLTELQIDPRPDITSWYNQWMKQNEVAVKKR